MLKRNPPLPLIDEYNRTGEQMAGVGLMVAGPAVAVEAVEVCGHREPQRADSVRLGQGRPPEA